MATDNLKLYVPISDRWVNRDYDKFAKPGLYAIDFETGDIIWSFILNNICENRKPLYGEGNCFTGFSAPVSIANDVLFAASLDGRFSAHSTKDGTKLWEFDTLKTYKTLNNQPAVGGSIDAAGPVISDNWVFVNSGYAQHGQMAGNVILAFSIE
jgi:polyvinyl alcohol dehydrogenase (cytochrome)